MNRDKSNVLFGSFVETKTEIDLTGQTPAVVPLFDANQIYDIRRGAYLTIIKPILDRIGGLLALIVLFPLLIVISSAVWVAMGSPVILKQDRVGQFGQVLKLYKFRTMSPDRRGTQVEFIGENRRQTHKSADDPRITPLGRWLRATRMDEIPQFINVVTGELSLVGPRPEMVALVAQYEPWQHRRHAIKPGVTGLWQVSDRGDKLLKECTEMELEYLDSISLRTDLSILLRTLPAMARRSGI